MTAVIDTSMNILIVGVDHMVQGSDASLKSILHGLMISNSPVVIGEENVPMLPTVAREVADESGIRWLQIDMSREQRLEQGIEQRLSSRMALNFASVIRGEARFDKNGNPIPDQNTYFEQEDGIRENFWLDGSKN